MSAHRPPALLAATALRQVSRLPLLVAVRPAGWTGRDRRVAHVRGPAGRSSPLLCHKHLVEVRPPGFQEARALPLCRGCARHPLGLARVDLVATRSDLAAWYGANILRAADRPGGGDLVQDLIGAAIGAGVVGLSAAWYEGEQPYPLHGLIAPFRARQGGLAEANAAESRRVLDASMSAPR